jgi:hypothetical protein
MSTRYQRARRSAIYRGLFCAICVFTFYIGALGVVDRITG